MFDQNPLITTASVVTLLTLVIALLRTFGVPITADQENLILKIVALSFPWIVVAIGHRKTTPLANPQAKDGEQLVRESGNTTPPSERVTRGL